MPDDELLKKSGLPPRPDSSTWETLDGLASGGRASAGKSRERGNRAPAAGSVAPLDVGALARLATRIDTELEARSIPPKALAPLDASRAFRPTWPMIAAPLAVAIAIVVWIARLPVDAPLPPYALAIEPSPLHRGGTFTIVVRPSMAPHGSTEAHAVLVHASHVVAWSRPLEATRDGSFRMSGAVDASFDADGAWEIDVAVGRPGLVPSAPEAIAHAAAEGLPAPGWQLARGLAEVTR